MPALLVITLCLSSLHRVFSLLTHVRLCHGDCHQVRFLTKIYHPNIDKVCHMSHPTDAKNY